MSKNFENAVLLDFYGDMLTDKQRNFLDYYYNDDLSLSEIAENEGISRQGVRDSIKKAEGILTDMEQKLHFVAKSSENRGKLSEIIDLSDKITDYNLHHSVSKELNDFAVNIKTLAMTLLEA